MKAELLKWSEDMPAAAGGIPDGLSEKAAAIDPFAIWSRLEIWTGHRWSERAFEAIIKGPGIWSAPVDPVSSFTAAEWWAGQWEAAEIVTGPTGLHFDRGTFRITGTAGANADPVPAAVIEAYRRLAEYTAKMTEEPGLISFSYNIGITVSERRERGAMANAIQLSGAADLLRPYRRVK